MQQFGPSSVHAHIDKVRASLECDRAGRLKLELSDGWLYAETVPELTQRKVTRAATYHSRQIHKHLDACRSWRHLGIAAEMLNNLTRTGDGRKSWRQCLWSDHRRQSVGMHLHASQLLRNYMAFVGTGARRPLLSSYCSLEAIVRNMQISHRGPRARQKQASSSSVLARHNRSNSKSVNCPASNQLHLMYLFTLTNGTVE